jgi:hypothetical protein
MHPAVELRIEGPRGCGHRKKGGIYLVCDGLGRPCGKLPIPLHVCPTCSAGIKPARGWTWIDGTALSAAASCAADPCRPGCPLRQPPGRVGLLWVGGSFYATPEEFSREAARLGISRRLAAVPKDFKLGETWVWLAHRSTPLGPDGQVGPAVFHAFLPSRIEIVVGEDDPEEEIERLLERGLTPVVIKRDTEQTQLPFSNNGISRHHLKSRCVVHIMYMYDLSTPILEPQPENDR